MTEDNQQSGGIHARKIQATNVVSGVQMQGGDAQQAANLVSLAQAIRRGDIHADEIIASNLVSGLQYISDPVQVSTEDLRKEVQALRQNVGTAIAAQEITDPSDAEDTQESLDVAEKELAKPQPNGQRVLRKLDEANTIITKSAEIAQSAGKVGAFVVQLAPISAIVWQVAQKLFGL